MKDTLIGRKQSELPKIAAVKPNEKKKAKTKILSLTSSDGWTIYVGRNRHENDHLLSRLAQPNDLWLHVRASSGSHVVIRTKGAPDRVPQSVLLRAAMIAALRSGQLRHAALDVFLTEPLPADDPLTRMENVTLSAHSAFRTPEASDKLIRLALDIARDLAGVGP